MKVLNKNPPDFKKSRKNDDFLTKNRLKMKIWLPVVAEPGKDCWN